jgi:lipopolysaccharide transport system ATP-binding protein
MLMTPVGASAALKVAVKFDRVSLEFPIYSPRGRSLKRSVLQLTTGGRIGLDARDRAVISALNDISFNVEHGERIGIVGHNGAGKSTLLRAIAGVYEPARGMISVCGKVGSLIDLTLGMDMEATGYENIRIRSLLLGLSRTEIAEYTDEIAQATELGEFLSMPIRTYSSGMLLRLAFAISTSVAPDILLMDEWIGVGDASFLKKAHDRLLGLVGRTGILFLASHSPPMIMDNCTRAIWLEKGEMRADGSPAEVLREYGAWSAAEAALTASA